MNLDPQDLLELLRGAHVQGLSLQQLTEQLHLGHGGQQQVRKALRALVRDGRATSDGHHYRIQGPASAAPAAPAPAAERPRSSRHAHQSAAFQAAAHASGDEPDPLKPVRGAATWGEKREPLPKGARKPHPPEFTGLLTLKTEGYGFVTPLLGATDRSGDLFVPPGKTKDAIDGDVVHVRTVPGRDGRPVAEVVAIVERRRKLALGAYRLRGTSAVVEPHDRRLSEPISVARDARFHDGDLVKVRLGVSTQGQMTGTVVAALGARGEARFEILSAAYAFGFSDEFDPETLAAAALVPDHVRAEDLEGRRDLRELPLVTIDGADARDFDDAVYVARAGEGYRLVVAIADVAHYVKKGSALDCEALRRATSVYFPSTVLPMLPERLSNGICSLNPKVDRLCMVCDLSLDREGRPTASALYPAVMNSHAQLTYEQVAEVLKDGEVPGPLLPLVPDLKRAGQLAKLLTARRFERGSIDFDLPEPKVVLDDQGSVKAIERRPRNDAHRLVEELMLAANEGVARFFDGRDLPTVYRIHDQPDAERLEAFGALAAAHGHVLPARLTPKALNDFLRVIDGTPAQQALNSLLLRAMMQAHYSPDNIGHYGLAAPTYLHFTSPIRRYPDLLVHRLLQELWARHDKPLKGAERTAQEEELAGFAAQCSERERAAMKAERDIDSFYAAVFMQGREGETFDAVVTGVGDPGLFCALQDPWVEGLVPAESLGDGVELDAALQRLVVGRSGKSFGVGDAVRVTVVSSDPVRRRISLKLEEVSASAQKPKGRAGEPRAHARQQAPAPERHVQTRTTAPRREPGRREAPARQDDQRPWLSEDDLKADSKPAPKPLPKHAPQGQQHQRRGARGSSGGNHGGGQGRGANGRGGNGRGGNGRGGASSGSAKSSKSFGKSSSKRQGGGRRSR